MSWAKSGAIRELEVDEAEEEEVPLLCAAGAPNCSAEAEPTERLEPPALLPTAPLRRGEDTISRREVALNEGDAPSAKVG